MTFIRSCSCTAPSPRRYTCLSVTDLQSSADALLPARPALTRSCAEVHEAIGCGNVSGHRDEEAFALDGRGPTRHGQIHVDAALNHRRGDHEDDQQHEHDVDERDDVDFCERRRHAPAAAAAPVPDPPAS